MHKYIRTMSKSLITARYRPRQYSETSCVADHQVLNTSFPSTPTLSALHVHHALLKDDAIPELSPALRRMAPRAMILYAPPMGQSPSQGGLPAYRILPSLAPSLGRVAPREREPHAAAFPHRIEHMEEGRGRRVYCEHPSVQWVERSQTAQIRSRN